MAIDKTLTLRPATIDIANNVDDILQQITPEIYGVEKIALTSDFEQYDTADNLIKIIKIGHIILMQGGIKKIGAQASAGNIKIGNLSMGLRPAFSRISAINRASGQNRYDLSIYNNGDMYCFTYGADSNIAITNNALLRIDAIFYTE